MGTFAIPRSSTEFPPQFKAAQLFRGHGQHIQGLDTGSVPSSPRPDHFGRVALSVILGVSCGSSSGIRGGWLQHAPSSGQRRALLAQQLSSGRFSRMVPDGPRDREIPLLASNFGFLMS